MLLTKIIITGTRFVRMSHIYCKLSAFTILQKIHCWKKLSNVIFDSCRNFILNDCYMPISNIIIKFFFFFWFVSQWRRSVVSFLPESNKFIFAVINHYCKPNESLWNRIKNSSSLMNIQEFKLLALAGQGWRTMVSALSATHGWEVPVSWIKIKITNCCCF